MADDATGHVPVRVVRSARRRRTVSAYRDGEHVVVQLPARMSAREEAQWVAVMVERVTRRERRTGSDAVLAARARALSRRYLDDRARPRSVRWVDNQEQRWGSCTPVDAAVRLSRRLAGYPDWVVDYVLLHELAHLLEPGHGPAFWALLARYPKLERARGFLEGAALTAAAAPAPVPDRPAAPAPTPAPPRRHPGVPAGQLVLEPLAGLLPAG